jgi:hypothetical protein
VLLGIAGFEVAVVASLVDLTSLYFTLATDAAPGLNAYWSKCDLASDFISWALNMVTSQGWSGFNAKDRPFWAVQPSPCRSWATSARCSTPRTGARAERTS